MARQSQFANPFYFLLIVVGVAFAITACAYGVMTVKQLDPMAIEAQSPSSREFSEFMDSRGPLIMIVELAVLAVLTFAAIGTDGYWSPQRPAVAELAADDAATASAAIDAVGKTAKVSSDSNNSSTSLN